MHEPRSIAVAQTIPRRGDVEANVEGHLRLIHLAAQERAQVLLFPELSLTGYELDLAQELAFSVDDARLAPLIDAASAGSLTLIVGAPVRIGTRFHIGAFILSPNGSIRLYTKQRLGAFPPDANLDGNVPPAESSVFAAGYQNPPVEFGGHHYAAIAICADIGQPSHPQAAADRGADTYLASMFVIPADLDQETKSLAKYAERHRMAVALANFGGPSGGLSSAGASAIWSEKGERLAQLAPAGIGIAVAHEDRAGWRAKTVMLEP